MAPWAVYSASMEFRLIDHLVVPAETKIDGFPFGGISGLDYDLTADRFVAISDARGGKFGPPRYYELDIQYTSYEALGLVVVGQHLLRAENGSSFPTATVRVDPEAIRLAPAGGLYWSSEGVVPKQGDVSQPFIRKMAADGGYLRAIPHPEIYNYAPSQNEGGRSNGLFEALALSAEGEILVVANETPLVQDGPPPTLDHGGVVRVSRLAALDGALQGQYAYQVPPIPVDRGPGKAARYKGNGLAELLAVGGGKFLALERSFVLGVGNTIRLVLTSFEGAEDIGGRPSLAGIEIRPMPREVILELPPEFDGIRMDNMEALSWGRRLRNGSRTLVMAADNNFNALGEQQNLFLIFEVVEQ